ncbi:MAG TPA: Ig-like domain-containing protein [Clostridia bacterium]|nr:Ig-like domain-containing protein [Clostridia bacterium]
MENLTSIFKNKKNRFIFLLVLLSGGMLLLKLLVAAPPSPQIINTSPADGQTKVSLNEKIILSFDQDISAEGWQIKASPDFAFNLEVLGNRLEIKPSESLKPESQYRLEIKNLLFKELFYSFSFTTAPISIPKAKGDPDFYEKLESSLQKNYPLLKQTPHQTPNWLLYYSGALKLKVVLQKDTPQIRKEVLDWIESKGINPNTHEIIWKVEEP